MTETFEYAVPADDRSAPRHSVALAAAFIVAFLLAIFAVGATPGRARAQGTAAELAITNVNLVDVERGRVERAMRVVVANGHVAWVGREADAARAPRASATVDGTGQWLIPGLWDMHVHASYPLFPAIYGPQMIAHGVTGVREMFGDLPIVQQYRRVLATPDTIWPRIVASGHIVDGKPPIWPTSVVATTEAEGRRAVDSLKAAGADFIKVYALLPRAAYLGIAARAREVGIPYAGHVSYAMTVAEASDAGQKSIEHMDGIIRACSTRDAEFRPAVRRVVEAGWGFDSIISLSRTQNQALLDSQDAATCDALAATLKRNGTWLSPTMVVLRGMGWADDSTLLADPRLQYMPRFITAGWNPKNDFRLRTMTPEAWARRKREFQRNLELVGFFHRKGVPLIAGTDLMNPWIFPGSSLHDELGWYVQAGLTPVEALRTATVNPARYLGLADSSGTIARGKWADLVLLGADPLADIGAVRDVRAVVANGRLVDAARRAAMLEKVKAMIAPAPRKP